MLTFGSGEKQLTLGHGKFFDQNLDLAYGKFGGTRGIK